MIQNSMAAPPKFNFRFIPVFLFFHFLVCIKHYQVSCLRRTAVLAPINLDPSTRRYLLSLYLKTPLQPTNLLLDLSAPLSWVDCSALNNNASSATFHAIPCGSHLCNSLASPRQVACASNGSCHLSLSTPRRRKPVGATVQALVDTLALPVTDGRNPGRQLRVVSEFVFSCSERSSSSLKGRVAGIVALGRSNFSLPAQVSTAFDSPKVFALCLSGSPAAPGVAFFGTPGPYYFFPGEGTDLSKNLNYTPLLSDEGNHRHRQPPSPGNVNEYFIDLTGIKVNGRVVAQQQLGGNRSRTKLSVGAPYTKLESSIYEALTEAFVNESAALYKLTPTQQPLRPFSVCYDAADIADTTTGPAVPTVDLVMRDHDDDSDGKLWRIFGWNSMVRMSTSGQGGVEDVWCLAFVDGGRHPDESSSVVMGGHQMVDNLLQFDLESQRLGFSSSVLLHNTMCANFNFTLN